MSYIFRPAERDDKGMNRAEDKKRRARASHQEPI